MLSFDVYFDISFDILGMWCVYVCVCVCGMLLCVCVCVCVSVLNRPGVLRVRPECEAGAFELQLHKLH